MLIEATTLKWARNLIVGLGMAMGLLVLIAPSRAAAQDSGWTQVPTQPAGAEAGKPGQHAKKSANERTVSVALTKGQTYVIHDVAKNGAPGVKVVNNPNALVVQNAPGRIVLVGAATGSWKLNVTMADGEKVIYEVSVTAAGTQQGSLTPGAAPTVMH
jgi:hypothetical protein